MLRYFPICFHEDHKLLEIRKDSKKVQWYLKEEVEEGIAAVKIEHDECFYVCPVLSAKDGSLYAQSKTFPPTRG